MQLVPVFAAIAAVALLAASPAPAFAADTQLAQGKSDKMKSEKSKGTEKSTHAMEKNEDRVTGRENAMERGEGEKKGLKKQMDASDHADKDKKNKKAKMEK